VALGNVDISVCSGPEVDPYFYILMPDPPIGWQTAWFLLRNDTDAPLPMFTSGCSIPRPNWEYGVARADLHRLQPLLEIVWGLLHRGPCRCLRGQVVPSASSPWSWVAWRSTPGYEGLFLLRMWPGRRPVVSVVNGCGHGGTGDRWRAT
jgi:hypothetical protein